MASFEFADDDIPVNLVDEGDPLGETTALPGPGAINFRKDRELTEGIQYSVPAAALALTDTISAGIPFTDNERGDVIKAVGEMGFKGLADFTTEYREALDIASELPFMFVPGTAGIKLFNLGRSAAVAGFGAQMSKNVRAALDPGNSAKLARLLKMTDKGIAKRTGQLDLNAIPARRAIRNKLYASTAINSAANAVAFEAGVYGMLNQSDVMYPETFDNVDMAVLLGAGIVLPTAVDTIIARKLANKSMRQATPYAHEFLNPTGRIGEAGARQGTRDYDITNAATNMQALNQQKEQIATGDFPTNLTNLGDANIRAKAAENLNKQSLEVEGIFRKQIETMHKEGLTLREETIDAKLADGKRVFQSADGISPAMMETLKLAAKDDPFIFVGMKGIDDVDNASTSARNPKTIRETLDAKSAEMADTAKLKRAEYDEKVAKGADLDKLEPLQAEIRKLELNSKELRVLQMHVVEPTGDFSLAETRKRRVYDRKAELKILKRRNGVSEYDDFALTYRNADNVEEEMLVRVNGDVVKGANTDFAKMSLTERSAYFAATQRMAKTADRWVPLELQKPGISKVIIPENAHWMRLQWAKKLLEENPAAVKDYIQLPEGMTNPRDLDFAIMAGKFQDYSNLMQRYEKEMQAGPLKALRRKSSLTIEDILYMTDLPQPAIHLNEEISETQKLFNHMYAEGARTSKQFSEAFQNYDKARASALRLKIAEGELPKDAQVLKLMEDFELEVTGNGMNVHTIYGKTPTDLKFAEPVLMAKRPVTDGDKSAENLQNLLTQRRLHRRANILQFAQKQLTNGEIVWNKPGAIVGDLYRLLADPQLNGGVNDVAIAAGRVDSLHEFEKWAGGVVSQAAHKNRDIEALRAMRDIVNLTDKRGHKILEGLYKTKFLNNATGKEFTPIDALQRIRQSANQKSSVLFDMFAQARRFAWDVEEVATQIEPGKFAFKLKDTKRNRQLAEKFFGGEALPKFMPNMNDLKNPVPVVLDEIAMDAAEAVSNLGGVVLDNTNAIRVNLGLSPINRRPYWVPPKNFAPGANKNVAFIRIPGESGLHPVTAGTKSQLDELVEKEIERLSADGFTAMRVDKETLAQRTALQDEYFAQMMDMSDVLKQSAGTRGRSGALTLETGPEVLNSMTESITKQFNSIIRRTRGLYYEEQIHHVRMLDRMFKRRGQTSTAFGDWLNEVTGGQQLVPDSIVGKTYGTIETVYDDAINTVYDKVRNFRKDVFGELNDRKTDTLIKEMREQFGEHMPFQNAAEFAERAYNIKPPASLRKHLAAVNMLTSTLTLRLFELGHPILNITGMMTTYPAVLRGLQRTDGEDLNAWKNRIGAYGTIVDGVPVLSPGKVGAMTFHKMFTAEGKQIVKDARARGLISQQVSEIMETLVAPSESLGTHRIQQAVDALSKPSDASEEIVRAFAHVMGYDIGKAHLKLKDPDVLHSFAHRFANDNIGDYHPGNKPQMFQGAPGMLLGLFQTYSFNYFNRLFSYIENKQQRAAVVQIAMQSAVFGAASVPGFDQFNNIIASNYDKSTNPVDSLRQVYGEEFADAFFYGTVSNLPKLFGAPDGMSFHTRGDANVQRIPSVFTVADTPGMNVITDFYDILNESVGMFRKGGQYSNQQMIEIMGRHFTNRPIRHLFEVWAGTSTDARGQVVNNDTRTGMAIAARLLGSKELAEAKDREISFRMRSTELSQRAIRNRSNQSLRSALRSGSFDGDSLVKFYTDYLASGGRPQAFDQYLKRAYLVSQVEKNTLLMKKLLSGGKLDEVARLVNMSSLPPNDPEFAE